MNCQHPDCKAPADTRFTLRLKGGRIVYYCREHWQARLTPNPPPDDAVATAKAGRR